MIKKSIKVALPFLLIAISIFSAFAFKSSDNAELSLEFGWINLPGDPCAIMVQCDNIPSNFICTAIYEGTEYQAFGKAFPTSTNCNKLLFRAW
jgi:hypothetical protein